MNNNLRKPVICRIFFVFGTAQMATNFKPESFLEYTTPMEINTFVKKNLRPILGPVKLACTSEVEGIITFIKEIFPLPITSIIKVFISAMHLS